MCVAIDCRYVRERPSGIGAYVEALVDRVPQQSPGEQFLFWAHRRARIPLTNAPNVRATTVPVEPNSLWTIRRPQRYASFKGVNLFHSPHNILPQDIPCRSVVTIHDLLPLEHPKLAFVPWSQRLKRWYYVKAMWRALHKSTRLIVTTSAMANRVAQALPEARKRTEIISLGVSTEFQPAPDPSASAIRAQDLIGSDAPYFLVVGQNAPHKRHGIALKAFARHAPKKFQLVFVQRTAIRSPVEHLARDLGLTNRIRQFSHLQTTELITLYQNATALIQPSLYDGFGLPLLEAMACGCPVIATDLPMFREVASNAAVFAPVDDVEAFGKAIYSLAKEPGVRRDLSAAGIERAAGFCWDRCAAQTLEVYHAAAA